MAEHVESGEVLELLAQFDIDYAQGYSTGAPVPMTDFLPLIKGVTHRSLYGSVGGCAWQVALGEV